MRGLSRKGSHALVVDMIALIGKILLVDDIFCDLRHAELLLDGTSRDEDHHCILLLGKNEAWMMIDVMLKSKMRCF